MLNSGFSKEQIIVQCIKGVSDLFLEYLERCGFEYILISPYLDKKYCNKIVQLDYFKNKEVESLILIDTDVYVLDDALYRLNSKFVCGKIVDAPNPPIDTIEHIFDQASLNLTDRVETDWTLPANETINGNFNGGFYYIPGEYIPALEEYWKKWASWLFERGYLFKNKAHAIHTDQISFAMALSDGKIPFASIASNYNFPLHSALTPANLIESEPLHLLHYHRELDDFGFINSDHLTLNIAKEAVSFANGQIASIDTTYFFYRHRRSFFLDKSYNCVSNPFKERCKQLSKYSHITIYLHAGTPKTATTSFQYLCANNRDALVSQRILYPSNFTAEGVPKHQWLVSALLQDSEELFMNNIIESLQEASKADCNSIILSTEGIYNHWWDFSDNAKSKLHELANTIRIEPLVVLREPFSFLYSFYRQNLKNPKMELVKCYGQSWTFQRMMQDKWFIKHLDYLGFICEIEALLGKSIQVLPYSKNIINRLFDAFGVDVSLLKRQEKHKNIGLSKVAVELLIFLNRFEWDPEDKHKIILKLEECDELLKKHDDNLSDIDKKAVTKLFQLQKRVLLERYDIVLQ